MKLAIAIILCIYFFQINNCFGREIKSGDYSSFCIVNNNGEIYGIYDLYYKINGKFSAPYNFYFYGKTTNSDTTEIKIVFAYKTTSKIITGYIISSPGDSINIMLPPGLISGPEVDNFYPQGYKAFATGGEFDANGTDNRYEYTLAIGMVKDSTCHLYSDTLEKAITKAYIIKGDYVFIVQTEGAWAHIMYQSGNPDINRKPITRWIKSSALYDKDPAKWK